MFILSELFQTLLILEERTRSFPELSRHIFQGEAHKYLSKVRLSKLDIGDLVSLAERLNLSVDILFRPDDVDFDSIIINLLGINFSDYEISEDYGGTFIDSLRAELFYLRSITNEQTYNFLLGQTGLTHEKLLYGTANINVITLNRVFEAANDLGLLNKQNLYNMAAYMYKVTRRKKMLSYMDNFTSLAEAFYYLTQRTKSSYEQNYSYSSERKSDHVKVILKGDPEIQEGLKLNNLSSPIVNEFRRMCLEVTADLCNLNHNKIIITKEDTCQKKHIVEMSIGY